MQESSVTPSRSKGSRVLGYLLKYGVPLIITVGLCYLLFHDIDFYAMLDTIRRDCDFRWIGAALAVSILSHVLRGARWRIQLRALGIEASLWELTLSIFGTYAVNLVFPRLGEVWRTGYVAERRHAPFATVFGSMVADRLADTITVLLITGFTFLLAGAQLLSYLGQNPEAYDTALTLVSSPWLWLTIIIVLVMPAFILVRYPEAKAVVKIRAVWQRLWDGFAVIVKMPGKGRWLLLTAGVWGCYFFQLYLAFFSFPVTAQVVTEHGVTAVLVCFVLSSISMAVPSNGGIGPWQWAVIFGLSLYPVAGLTQEYATTFANLVMGTQTLLLILLGIFTFTAIALQRNHSTSHSPSTSAYES
ncbi:MAG: flippase-like domain-containing protein [Bacteroidales bacterium]|nr:flippase-like domain-containing protein [Bacteroidales bacterium]